ncbi:MAG: 7-cyano-7-deazaguanine synthase QueC [Gemmatimonadota bacterium]|nr:7-cyano-7-deazaguanine synthase QueC [Gemmatimonadota bacterium]
MPSASPAVVLLSGGLDSTTVLAIAKRDGFELNALSFQYGQRHGHEIDAARRIARLYGVVRHEIATIDLRIFGGSALTSSIPVPKSRDLGSSAAVPVTYVPARNTIFLSFALAFAEVTGARDVFIGVNSLDFSGYPDCRPAYITAFERMANLATRLGTEGEPIHVRTPLMYLTKAEIIKLGAALGVDYSMTSSCYDPSQDGAACGECDACQLRLAGFNAAGLRDPAAYMNTPREIPTN